MNKAVDPALMHAAEVAGSQGLGAYWMPFTANRQFKKAPRLLAKAKDMHFWTPEGRQILDGIAGLWCVNAGHARPKIVKAIAEQAGELDYAPPFQMGHPKAFTLAEKVVELAPDGMNKVFFTNSGSEAVETALKMAIAYHRARGEGQHAAAQTNEGARAGHPFPGWGGDGHGGPALSAQPEPGDARPVFNENAGINGVRHLVHVVDIARVHCRRVVATAFQFHRQRNGIRQRWQRHDVRQVSRLLHQHAGQRRADPGQQTARPQ